MKFNSIKIDNTNEYTIISLSRPEKHNALSEEMVNELSCFFSHLMTEANPHFILMRGLGKTFCSGADLNDFARENATSYIEKLSDLFFTINSVTIPVITYAHGNIFGGGIGLLAVSDFVVAQKNSKFCFSEVKFGLVPALISTYLGKKVSVGHLKHYMISGHSFDAKRAMEIGLVNVILEADFEKNLNSFCDSLLLNDFEAMKETKFLLNRLTGFSSDEDKKSFTENVLKKMIASEETKGRLLGFLNK